MVDHEEKAKQFLFEADKKLGPWVLGGLFTGSAKTEEALELMKSAANQYKMGKNWTEAGNTFRRIGTHHARRRNKMDAAANFVSAGNCYRKKEGGEAVSCLTKALAIYLDMGRMAVVARTHQTIAEIYESEKDHDKAMKHYELAADFFRSEDSNSSAKSCMVKVAELSAKFNKYEAAIVIYEQVAHDALESPLLKYGAKDYYFRAAICHLAVDYLSAKNAISRYIDHYPAFEDSREAKLVLALCHHVDQQDCHQFDQELQKYQSVLRLDPWFLDTLVKVKENISDKIDLR